MGMPIPPNDLGLRPPDGYAERILAQQRYVSRLCHKAMQEKGVIPRDLLYWRRKATDKVHQLVEGVQISEIKTLLKKRPRKGNRK